MVIYWICFGLICAGHLSTCFLELEKARKITKVFIVPTLMVGLLLTRTYYPLLFVGLTLGWIGDVCLIITGKYKKVFFVIGGISFLAGHFCYIAATFSIFFASFSLADIPIWIYVILSIAAVIFILLFATKIRKKLGLIAWLGAFYFYILVVALLTSYLTGYYLLPIGFAVFMISDSILSITRFGHPVKREHFYIMSTYILAQTLICISFMLQN